MDLMYMYMGIREASRIGWVCRGFAWWAAVGISWAVRWVGLPRFRLVGGCGTSWTPCALAGVAEVSPEVGGHGRLGGAPCNG
eukprot:1656893-Pyramimonas_sp.AAC.1